MRVWIVYTVHHKTGKIRASFVIDTTDEDEETFLRSQEDRFGDRFVKAELQGVSHE